MNVPYRRRNGRTSGKRLLRRHGIGKALPPRSRIELLREEYGAYSLNGVYNVKNMNIIFVIHGVARSRLGDESTALFIRCDEHSQAKPLKPVFIVRHVSDIVVVVTYFSVALTWRHRRH